jgi:TolB-like protein
MTPGNEFRLFTDSSTIISNHNPCHSRAGGNPEKDVTQEIPLKNQIRKTLRNALFATLTLLVLGSVAPAIAAPVRVAVLPFDINAEKDLTFLQEGILDMLGSRLAWQDKVDVINENETKAALASVEGFQGESRALLVGGKLQANYVLFGSLTVFGESVSIDAKMVDVSGQQAPLPFFAQTGNMGEVIPQINQFATNINATVFGRGVAQRPVVAPAPQAAAAPAAGVQPAPPAYDPRMHPEKLLQSGIQSETQVPVAGQPYQTPNPAFVATTAPRADSGGRTFWKSRSFKTLINGIDIADVDNDGRQEIVMATEKLVAIYRMENGRLVKAAETVETRTSSYVGVDVADINGNGTPEIYVSSLGPNRSSVDSFVLEFDGNDYKMIHGKENWFYRVANTADRGTLLLGQRMRTAEESVFRNPVQELQWQGNRLVPGNRLLEGRKANLLGLAYGDIALNGQSQVIAYSTEDRLRLYNATGTGDYVWEESERSGGNMAYFKPPKAEPGVENKQFFPLRIRLTDIDRDGKTEVLVAGHDELANNMAKDFRSFSKARLESKVWDGLTLSTQWKTQEFSGRASDFVVGDFDNDGADELVVAVVAKEGAIIFSDAVCNLVAFDLNVR